MGLKWRGLRVSSFLVSTSPTNYCGPKTPRQFVRGHSTTFFPLRRLKIFGMGHQKVYSCTIESVLTGCITTWYGNCSVSDRKALQRVMRTSQYITGAKRPDIQDLYTRLCQRKAQKLVKDSSHQSHRLFSLLLHDKRHRSVKSKSKRVLNSFYLQAISIYHSSVNAKL